MRRVKNNAFVSTHSRAEAAANSRAVSCIGTLCFNTQPRRGGCDAAVRNFKQFKTVSTHSRAEAAASTKAHANFFFRVSTHSRAEAAASG